MIRKMAHKRSFSEMTTDDISIIQEDILNLEKQFELFTLTYCEDYNRIMYRARLQDFALVIIIICLWMLIAK
jgi:hypothetical protein